MCLFPTHTDLIFVRLEPNHQLLNYDMNTLKLIAMSPVVRVHPTTGPWWKQKANALEKKQYHPSLASLLGKVVAGWDISCREDSSRRRLLVAEAVETNGAELKVNDTGARVPLLPAERQLVEASVEEAHNERRSWTTKKDLGTLVLKVHGVNSGFKRSREQVADAATNLVRKLKKQRSD